MMCVNCDCVFYGIYFDVIVVGSDGVVLCCCDECEFIEFDVFGMFKEKYYKNIVKMMCVMYVDVCEWWWRVMEDLMLF